MESQAFMIISYRGPWTTNSGKRQGVGGFRRGLTENVIYSSKRVWRVASPLPIYGKSPCGAEGEEKARYPTGA